MYVLGNNIRVLRINCNMKQEELAKRIGVSKATVSNYENGITKPSFSKLPRIADALGVEVSALFDGTAQKKNFSDIHSPMEKLDFKSGDGEGLFDSKKNDINAAFDNEPAAPYEKNKKTGAVVSYPEPIVLGGDIPRAEIYEDENGNAVIFVRGKVMLFEEFEGGSVFVDIDGKMQIVDTNSDKGRQFMCGNSRIGEIISF